MSKKPVKYKIINKSELIQMNSQAFMESRAAYLNPYELENCEQTDFLIHGAKYKDDKKIARVSLQLNGESRELDIPIDQFNALGMIEITIEVPDEAQDGTT